MGDGAYPADRGGRSRGGRPAGAPLLLSAPAVPGHSPALARWERGLAAAWVELAPGADNGDVKVVLLDCLP